MKKRATAIAIATVMVATGLSIAPAASAQVTNCAATYAIADSEAAATPRILLGGMEEIGVEEVLAGNDEQLHVRLDSPNDELDWKVFQLDSGGECVEYTSTGCGGNLDREGQTGDCTLEAPGSGVQEYFLKVENLQNDRLTYTPWSEL